MHKKKTVTVRFIKLFDNYIEVVPEAEYIYLERMKNDFFKDNHAIVFEMERMLSIKEKAVIPEDHWVSYIGNVYYHEKGDTYENIATAVKVKAKKNYENGKIKSVKRINEGPEKPRVRITHQINERHHTNTTKDYRTRELKKLTDKENIAIGIYTRMSFCKYIFMFFLGFFALSSMYVELQKAQTLEKYFITPSISFLLDNNPLNYLNAETITNIENYWNVMKYETFHPLIKNHIVINTFELWEGQFAHFMRGMRVDREFNLLYNFINDLNGGKELIKHENGKFFEPLFNLVRGTSSDELWKIINYRNKDIKLRKLLEKLRLRDIIDTTLTKNIGDEVVVLSEYEIRERVKNEYANYDKDSLPEDIEMRAYGFYLSELVDLMPDTKILGHYVRGNGYYGVRNEARMNSRYMDRSVEIRTLMAYSKINEAETDEYFWTRMLNAYIFAFFGGGNEVAVLFRKKLSVQLHLISAFLFPSLAYVLIFLYNFRSEWNKRQQEKRMHECDMEHYNSKKSAKDPYYKERKRTTKFEWAMNFAELINTAFMLNIMRCEMEAMSIVSKNENLLRDYFHDRFDTYNYYIVSVMNIVWMKFIRWYSFEKRNDNIDLNVSLTESMALLGNLVKLYFIDDTYWMVATFLGGNLVALLTSIWNKVPPQKTIGTESNLSALHKESVDTNDLDGARFVRNYMSDSTSVKYELLKQLIDKQQKNKT